MNTILCAQKHLHNKHENKLQQYMRNKKRTHEQAKQDQRKQAQGKQH